MVRNKQNRGTRARLNGIERVLQNQVIFAKAVLTIDEAPRYLGITRKQLNEIVRMRVIPFHIQLGHIYFKRSELDSWMIDDKRKGFYPGILRHLLKLVPWLSILIKFLAPCLQLNSGFHL
jgi:excisionase family DNA binding protein